MKRNAIVLAACTAFCFAAQAKPLELLTENNPPYNYAEGTAVKGTGADAVNALIQKAGLEGKMTVLKWEEAYARTQRNANTCIFSTARVPSRERLFKWYGPIATNEWAIYALPTFSKPVTSIKEARFHKIGAVKHDAKVDYLRSEGASSIREAEKDTDNPARLAKPKTDPDYIELWVTTRATAKDVAAKNGVKEIKEVLVLPIQNLYLACNPRTEKATLEKLEAASKK
ncbi:substrate-binding periplasmic protein [Usitatibacter palustris]|uniref:Uncharacterized protein n=1 Tax=Usitatibacter palustris TaxID=2732487 RepID=A0A6M4H5G7_9PROT|nr:transporter substrate-binding domain-containing protein [Usitatibacter palustris]QJR14866.1 hypothetical protein DSM104440_01681 [Usitatibacter palustris]